MDDAEKIVFPCVHCSSQKKPFATAEGLHSHNTHEHHTYDFRCRKCFNVFETESNLEQHFNEEHSSVPQRKPKKSPHKGSK
ncbi:hypothetical protein LINGRAHAP2_LOCUS31200 [Linum grandiflorum]